MRETRVQTLEYVSIEFTISRVRISYFIMLFSPKYLCAKAAYVGRDFRILSLQTPPKEQQWS